MPNIESVFMNLVTLENIKCARERIEKFIRKTPLIHSEFISNLCKGNVYLKLENLQFTNSFKIRGAINRILKLSAEQKALGVISASTGNHAQGVALAAQKLGISAKIVVPTQISAVKLKNIKKYDIKIIQEGNFNEIETRARIISKSENLTYISPYNDIDVITGQGTIALEIFKQIKEIDSIIVPIGGGGLISGIAVAIKSLEPNIKIIGVQTKGASTMYESWKVGKVLHIEEFQTIAKGLSGGLEDGTITLELIKKYVDEISLVQEESIKQAISILWNRDGQIIEGAGATSVAYILENKDRFLNKKVIAILSGGNIGDSLFRTLIQNPYFTLDNIN